MYIQVYTERGKQAGPGNAIVNITLANTIKTFKVELTAKKHNHSDKQNALTEEKTEQPTP